MDLANAIKELYKSENEIKIIGSRHGEKLYETLLTKEEYLKAEDLGSYYRVPSDNRDLNYEKYLETGEMALSVNEDYNSHNTRLLLVHKNQYKFYEPCLFYP